MNARPSAARAIPALFAALLAAALAPAPAAAATYYVSTTGKSSADGGTGTRDNPYDLATGVARAGQSAGHDVRLLPGLYKLTSGIGINGSGARFGGDTGDPKDVILDAQGQSEVLRLANDILVHSLTISNGVNASQTDSSNGYYASGVRLGASSSTTGQAVVSNCVVTGCVNSKGVLGAAVVMFDRGVLVDSVVRGNTGDSGAGINARASGGQVVRCLVAENSATDHGAGVCMGTRCDLTIVDSVISNNVSGKTGAGVALRSSTMNYLLELDGCTVIDNTAATSHGGGLAAIGGKIVAKNCTFKGNTAKYGGGVNLYQTARLVADGCLFEGNAATDTAVPSKDNSTTGAGGGAVLCRGTTSGDNFGETVWGGVWATNCTFSANTSQTYGGAASHSVNDAVVWEFVDCKFLDNVGVKWGGALCMRDGSKSAAPPVLVRQCLFSGNVVKSQTEAGTGTDNTANAGAFYFVSYGSPVLDACTFAGNKSVGAGGNGGAIYHKWGGKMVNCVVAGNTVNGETDSSAWFFNNAANASSNNCVYPDSHKDLATYMTAANGNIFADPLFADATSGDYSLQDGSPCKGKGLNEDWMLAAGATDLAGIKRIYGETVDIGAYEIFVPAVFVVVVR